MFHTGEGGLFAGASGGGGEETKYSGEGGEGSGARMGSRMGSPRGGGEEGGRLSDGVGAGGERGGGSPGEEHGAPSPRAATPPSGERRFFAGQWLDVKDTVSQHV